MKWSCLGFLIIMPALFWGCATPISVADRDAIKLHSAAWRGDINSVRALLNAGADVNAKAPTQWASTIFTARGTPLHFATFKKHGDIVRLLIDRGADIKATNVHGYTPLEVAEKLGLTYIAVILMEADKEAFKRQQAKAPERIPVTAPAAAPVGKSDVDELPSSKAPLSKNSYAIVIGIEDYRQKLPRADFAAHDARTVTKYLTGIMGYPEENVITLLNDHASNVDLVKYIEKWLPNNLEAGGTVFLYFSGHGAPNPTTGEAFLVPYDGDPAFITETGYPLKRLYAALKKLPAQEVVVALDSCFSGSGGRSVIAAGARPLVMRLEKELLPAPNIAVLAAAAGDQISSTYTEKEHGLFTYFMLQGLQGAGDANGDGAVGLAELYEYLKPRVESTARKTYNNEQSPQVLASPEALKTVLAKGLKK